MDMSESEPPRLHSLSQDILACILAELNADSVLSLLSVCRSLATSEESLWKSLSHKSWPQIDGLALPHEPWKTTYRRRVAIGAGLCRHLDASADCIACLASCTRDHSSEDAMLCRALARELFAIAVSPAYTQMRHTPDALAWARRVGIILQEAPGVLEALSMWAYSLVAELETWYDAPAGASTLIDLRQGLVRALSGRSAVQVMADMLRIDAHAAPTDAWASARLPDAATEIESTIHSMAMEGFNMSVPLHMRPVGIPPHHVWWLAAPPMHRDGLMC